MLLLRIDRDKMVFVSSCISNIMQCKRDNVQQQCQYLSREKVGVARIFNSRTMISNNFFKIHLTPHFWFSFAVLFRTSFCLVLQFIRVSYIQQRLRGLSAPLKKPRQPAQRPRYLFQVNFYVNTKTEKHLKPHCVIISMIMNEKVLAQVF